MVIFCQYGELTGVEDFVTVSLYIVQWLRVIVCLRTGKLLLSAKVWALLYKFVYTCMGFYG